MNAIILYFWQLSLCRENPKNSPYSLGLMLFCGFLLLILLVMQWWLSDFEISADLLFVNLAAFCLLVSYVLYTYALLAFRNIASRAVQTITCLFATHTIVHLFAMPLILTAPFLNRFNLENPLLLLLAVVYLMATLGLSIWQFIITAHIYKDALDCNPVQSVLAAFGLIAVNILTLTFWR
ncbi:MAG: hypothetical protein EPN84_06610 [Legionella sp.]|nr:MAG: hypothetical protein EPN84_06610 [Legionella sp.]